MPHPIAEDQDPPDAPSADPVAVHVCGLRKTFGAGPTHVEALRGVDLDVTTGAFVAVMGPSGSGKSTLLHLVGGLDHADEGSIEIGGQSLAALDDDALTILRRRSLGFVFQAFNLVPVLTAVENVALPLRIDGRTDGEAEERARYRSRRGGARGADGARTRPSCRGASSNGSPSRARSRRVPCSCSPTSPPAISTAAPARRSCTLLRRLCDERELTIVMVTHDPRDAACADRLVRMVDGRARLGSRRPRGGTCARERRSRCEVER